MAKNNKSKDKSKTKTPMTVVKKKKPVPVKPAAMKVVSKKPEKVEKKAVVKSVAKQKKTKKELPELVCKQKEKKEIKKIKEKKAKPNPLPIVEVFEEEFEEEIVEIAAEAPEEVQAEVEEEIQTESQEEVLDTPQNQLKQIIEGALFAASAPMSAEMLGKLFLDEEKPALGEIRQALTQLQAEYGNRGIELVSVSSGYRFQVAQAVAPYIAKTLEEKPARYSRALLETLALIAYRQPITRGEVEDIRGVVVSTHIIKTLHEQEWIRIVGYKEVPGKPALYATTKAFLDHFGLNNLSDLPPLAELKDLDSIDTQQIEEAAAYFETPAVDSENSQEFLEEDLGEILKETLEENLEETLGELEPILDIADDLNEEEIALDYEQENLENSDSPLEVEL